MSIIEKLKNKILDSQIARQLEKQDKHDIATEHEGFFLSEEYTSEEHTTEDAMEDKEGE